MWLSLLCNYSAPRKNNQNKGWGARSPERFWFFFRGGQGAERLWTPTVPNAQHLGLGVLNSYCYLIRCARGAAARVESLDFIRVMWEWNLWRKTMISEIAITPENHMWTATLSCTCVEMVWERTGSGSLWARRWETASSDTGSPDWSGKVIGCMSRCSIVVWTW